MVCFNLKTEIDESIRPIYNLLKRRGWGETVELLSAYTNCKERDLPNDFSFTGDNDDPYKVVMRPVEHPTELFTSLQQRDWATALNCLHRKPSETRTWIYCETDFPHSQMLWKQLPLHAAIALGAPAYLILALLDAYPDAAKKWDLKKSLPIHLAASRVDVDVDGERILQHLLRVFPESAGLENGKGRTPIELAFGAQIRKDKQNKGRSLNADVREPKDEGFELQLEMRDVMESFKSDDNNDPSAWSLADTMSSSQSYSSRSENTDTNSMCPNNSKSGVITESCVSGGASSSSYARSSSTDGTQSLAFQSVQMKMGGLSLVSSVSLASSTDSSVRESFSLSQTSAADISPESKSRSFTSNRGTSVEKDAVGLAKQNSEVSSQSSEVNVLEHVARSYDLPSKSSLYSTALRSLPSPLMTCKTRSRSTAKKTRINCEMMGGKSKPDGGGSKKISFSIDLGEPVTLTSHHGLQQQQKQGYKQSRSFEIPPRLSMYSAPARSTPSPLNILKSCSRSVQRQAVIDCDSFRKNHSEVAVDRYSSPMDLNESVAASLKSDSSDQRQEKVCRQACSFDFPPRVSMYESPVQSLPSSLEGFEKHSRSVGTKSSLDTCNNDFANDSSRDKAVPVHSTSVRDMPKQIINDTLSLGKLNKKEGRDAGAKDSSFDFPSTRESPDINERYVCTERSEAVQDDCSVKTEAATPLSGTWHQNAFSADHEILCAAKERDNLRLTAVIENENDDHSYSPSTETQY